MDKAAPVTPLGSSLPSGWRIAVLGPMCSKIGSGATPTGGSAAYIDSGISFIRSQNVFDHAFSWSGLASIDDEAARKLANATVKPRDVLLNITGDGETIARCCVVPADVLPARVNQHVMIVRPRPGLAPEFLQRYLSHPLIREYMLSHNSGGSRRALTKGQVERFEILVPPIAEQYVIASALSALDDKIAINHQIAAASHKLAELMYQERTRNQPTTSLSSLVKPILGGTPDRSVNSYWGSGIPWASAKDVAATRYGTLVSTEEEITKLAVDTTRVKPVPKGSVILTARGTVGAVVRVCQPTSLNQSCYAFLPDMLQPSFLYLTIRAAAQRMLGIAHGTVFSTVNMKTLEHIHVPSLSREAMSAIEKRTTPLLDAIEGSVRESRALAKLRDTMLPALMSGEIRVREAERLAEDAT